MTDDSLPELRASDADRERTVERLHGAAVEGRLDAEELEERIDAAYRARWTSELVRALAHIRVLGLEQLWVKMRSSASAV